MMKLIEKANILIEALPFIKQFYGKTMIIKYGGSAMIDPRLKEMVIQDIILMKYVGINPVIVHGGGKHISELMQRLGKEVLFLDGLRVTDKETMDITEMVLTGAVNKEIVSLLNLHGGKAVGVSGKDGMLIEAKKKTIINSKDYGFVGEITKINPKILEVLDQADFIPVVSPIGFSKDGHTFNINADNAAGEIAAALKASKLILLTDIRGVCMVKDDESTLISSLKISEVQGLKDNGIIKEGMLPKIDSCIKAFEKGVEKIHIIDGRISHSILLELFTEEGIGTQIIK
ncbi:MAG: acetylglutamate kinase [Spirochaetota bacterium]|nr:acetylglutamate kinase [Spirochaetota bacterium]